MRIFVILISVLTLVELHAQSPDLIGIYQVDWGNSPSYRYLILDCDSSYRFITHWDFGGEKDISPPITETKKWHLDKDNKVVLETEVYKYRSFEVLPNKNLRHTKRPKNVMIKIGTIKSDCSISDFIYSFRPENYSIARFLSGLKIISSETIVNNKLKQITTYHTLTDQEYSDLIGTKMFYRTFPDKIMEVKVKIGLFETVWPVEKIETWDNGELTIKYFDKLGQEIKKGD
jgi:hypothetical protein